MISKRRSCWRFNISSNVPNEEPSIVRRYEYADHLVSDQHASTFSIGAFKLLDMTVKGSGTLPILVMCCTTHGRRTLRFADGHHLPRQISTVACFEP